jgi:hypothetical protein
VGGSFREAGDSGKPGAMPETPRGPEKGSGNEKGQRERALKVVARSRPGQIIVRPAARRRSEIYFLVLAGELHRLVLAPWGKPQELGELAPVLPLSVVP